VQDQRISVTKRSVNLIKEYRNYLWEIDKNGKVINESSPINNHSMDALRYAIESLYPQHNEPLLSSLPQFQPMVDSDLGL
jgi:phage terminase large subunit